MTKPFTKQQSKDIAEKAAIIANTAFGLGRDAERARLTLYIKGQQCQQHQDQGDCDHDNCYLLGDVIAYANQTGKHVKNEVGLNADTPNA
jgi:hypothetical protein